MSKQDTNNSSDFQITEDEFKAYLRRRGEARGEAVPNDSLFRALSAVVDNYNKNLTDSDLNLRRNQVPMLETEKMDGPVRATYTADSTSSRALSSSAAAREARPTQPEQPTLQEKLIDAKFNFNSNYALGIESCLPNFMPYSASFQATDMYKRAISRIPVLNVVQLNTKNFSESLVETICDFVPGVGKILKTSEQKAEDRLKDISAFTPATSFDRAADKIKNNITIKETDFNPFKSSEAKAIPTALAMLFMTFTSTLQYRFKLPIMSSPTLDVKTGAGWEKSTSLFPFITKLVGGLGGSMIEKFAGSVSSLLQYMGKDILIGPLFSTKTINENRPSFTCTTYFVNDSSAAAKHNKTILQNLLMGSLPSANGGLNISPGSLFNVAIEIGLGKKDNGKKGVLPLKKMFLCTGNFNIKALGIYRDGVTPEIYELTSTFESLLPDFVNMQMISFSLQKQVSAYEFEENKPVTGTDIFQPT